MGCLGMGVKIGVLPEDLFKGLLTQGVLVTLRGGGWNGN